MKLIASALLSVLLLSGCTDADWNGAMRSVGMGDDAPEVVSAAPVVVAAPDTRGDDFCQAVAQQDIQRHSYDRATQQRVMTRSFQQCMTLHEVPR